MLDVLRVRGLDVPAGIREHILSCADLVLLDTWLERAVTAKSIDDVIGG